MEAREPQSTDLYHYLTWAHEHRRQLIIAGALVAAVVVGILLWRWQQQQSGVRANQALFLLPPAIPFEPNAPVARSEDFIRVSKEHPKSTAGEHALLLAAGSLYSESRYGEAQQHFEKFLNTYPDSPFFAQASLGVASSLDAQGKTDDAVAKYQQVVARHANEPSVANGARMSLAAALERQKKPAEALKIYDELMRTRSMSLSSEAMMRREKLLLANPSLAQTNMNAMPAPSLTMSNLTRSLTNITLTNRPPTATPGTANPK